MSIHAVLLPLFVQVALTFVLLFWMAFGRIGAIKRKETKMADVALGQLNWPPRVQQISNSYHSQLQLPVLFYVLTNFGMWIAAPSMYAHTFNGLLECYVAAIPFFRNTLLGDLGYVAVLFGLFALVEKLVPSLQLERISHR